MVTPAKRVEAYLNKLFDAFVKTKYTIPAAILLTGGIYYLMQAVVPMFCLSALIPPFFLVGILWKFNIKDIKRMFIAGAVACLLFSGITLWYYTDAYQHLQDEAASSESGVLSDGRVTPLYGDDEVVYNYTLTINLRNSSFTVEEVSTVIFDVGYPAGETKNYTMTLANRSDDNLTLGYYYATSLSHPVNAFMFWAKINGSWEVAWNYNNEVPLVGPVFKDTWAVAGALATVAVMQSYLGFLPIYGLFILMIWWTRRARRMREKALEKWETERAKETAEAPKDKGARAVPSLSKAMGMSSDDSFVCSECGADVPADATVCPKCGEKFE